ADAVLVQQLRAKRVGESGELGVDVGEFAFELLDALAEAAQRGELRAAADGCVPVERCGIEAAEFGSQRRIERDDRRLELVARLQAGLLGAASFGQQQPQLLSSGA